MKPLSPAEIAALLARQYGPIERSPHRDPLSQLVMTILSQNTSDTNSRLAFSRLAGRFPDWEAVAEADVKDIYEAIKPGGLGQVKAPRIKAILQDILARHGRLDLGFLERMTLPEAMSWLQELSGIGPKSAAVVLLFSLGRPVLPVDTHVYRVAKRLGLIDARISAEKAHGVLGAMVPPGDVYDFHIYMVLHGRRTCRARNPLCTRCALLPGCPTGQRVTGWG